MLKQNFDLLRCPDDRNNLLWKGKDLECIKCKRVFHAFSNNLVELLPSKHYPFKTSVEKNYITNYVRLLEDTFEWNPFGDGRVICHGLPRDTKHLSAKKKESLKNVQVKISEICSVNMRIGNLGRESYFCR